MVVDVDELEPVDDPEGPASVVEYFVEAERNWGGMLDGMLTFDL